MCWAWTGVSPPGRGVPGKGGRSPSRSDAEGALAGVASVWCPPGVHALYTPPGRGHATGQFGTISGRRGSTREGTFEVRASNDIPGDVAEHRPPQLEPNRALYTRLVLSSGARRRAERSPRCSPPATRHVIIELMFDGWQPWQDVRPPRPVVVDLALLWPPERLRWGRETPLRVRAGGVDVTVVRGMLTRWVLTCTGDWLGLVEGLECGSRNGELRLRLGPQLVRAAALRPAPADQQDGPRGAAGVIMGSQRRSGRDDHSGRG